MLAYTERCASTGKMTYTSKKEAKKALKQMRIKRDYTDTLHVYCCAACGYHHLGTKTIDGKTVGRVAHRRAQEKKKLRK